MYDVKRSSCIAAHKYLDKIHTNMEYKKQLFDWLPIPASSLTNSFIFIIQNYPLPTEQCTTYAAMYDELRKLRRIFIVKKLKLNLTTSLFLYVNISALKNNTYI
jgi:hypothetical protein